MTREEHLKFCKKCVNRKLDMKIGLICSLTGEKADFENECESFEIDQDVVDNLDNTEAIEPKELLAELSDENRAKFRSEQEYLKGTIAAVVSGILGAFVWGLITVTTGFQIGYMAIGIGAIIGLSMRFTGKGLDQIFGITGSVIAVLSCLLGNFLSIIGFIAHSENIGYFETLASFDYSQVVPALTSTISVIGLLFYAIAAVAGYILSFRKITERELHEIEKKRFVNNE